jgi:alpha-amylase/alpha-mannosidase (GH57 family)
MTRQICIHAHFYQPPRENPWLEAVELQDSAFPYHDWNQRITTECYAANAAARILDDRGRIDRITSNYARISFNVGPTLLAWLEQQAPDTYAAILAADDESRRRFNGHGSAIAQAYNHTILPLAPRADKVAQVAWGVRDFRHRFGRDPEGLWLPEAAVDVETLEVAAAAGVRFTVLAPHQAARVRRLGARNWDDVSGAHIDPTMPYVVRLPSGGSIAVFFYDGPVSRAVAFEHLLDRGENLAGRLAGSFDDRRAWPQLVHIATDGETYGHHHRFGEMALAYAIDYIEAKGLAKLTNYGAFLEAHPPTFEAEIVPSTSWSCSHGIERWRADCGCNSGGHPGWTQAWRRPLRDALDWLRDALASLVERRGHELFRDPSTARDEYIAVVLDRSPDSVRTFLDRQGVRPLSPRERTDALRLLEMQRHVMLMYTSCGWFFDEISGIETVQILQYAARAIQLGRQLSDTDLEPRFLALLERAPSNRPDLGDGRRVYERLVRPAMLDLRSVGAHVAVSSLFDGSGERRHEFCYDIEHEDRHRLEAGRLRLGVGRFRIASRITLAETRLAFGVLHFGDHNLSAGVAELDADGYRSLVRESREAFERADIPAVIRLLDNRFRGLTYSLASLFRDEQRRVLDTILASSLAEAEGEYRQLYDQNAPLMNFLSSLRAPLPKAFRSAADVVINSRLQRALASEPLNLEHIKELLGKSEEYGVQLDAPRLALAIEGTLGRMGSQFAAAPDRLEALRHLVGAVGLATSLPFDVNLWLLQNLIYPLRESAYVPRRQRAAEGDRTAASWAESFEVLGTLLHIRVP